MSVFKYFPYCFHKEEKSNTTEAENKLYKFYTKLKALGNSDSGFYLDCGEDNPILYVKATRYDDSNSGFHKISLFIVRHYIDNRRDAFQDYSTYLYEEAEHEYSFEDFTYSPINRVITLDEFKDLMMERYKKYEVEFKNVDCSEDWYHYGDFENTSLTASLYRIHIDAKVITNDICEVIYSVSDMIYNDVKDYKMGSLEWYEFKRMYSKVCPEYIKTDKINID